MSNSVKNLVTELPKSPLPAAYATEGDEFTFFVSGPQPLDCDKYIIDGEAIVLSTGGNAAVHYGKGKFSYSTDCWALQPLANSVEGKYLYYFLSSQIDRIGALGFEGSGLKHLRKDFVRNYEVPDLSKLEQSKIAEVLSTVDQAIEQTEALIAKQQRIKTGLMQDLLTRGIDEQGNLRFEETHEFKDSPLGRIPVEWEQRFVGDFVESSVDGPFGSNLKTEHYVDEPGIRVLRLQNIGNGEFIDDDKAWISLNHAQKLARHAVLPGDILIGSLGDEKRLYGRACLYPETNEPAIVKADVFRIRCKNRIATHGFVFRLFNLQKWRSGLVGLAQGVTRDRVNLSNLMLFKIPVPRNIVEQHNIAEILDKAEKSIIHVRINLAKLRSLKTALMQDLLTGKVRVTSLMEKKKVCA